MVDYFTSGRAADFILLVLVIELAWLVLGRRMGAQEALATVLPGLLLVIALRSALVGAAWPWIAVPLALSFPVHVMDLRRRLGTARRS